MPDPIPTNRSVLRFGVDVGAQLRTWFRDVYLPDLHKKFGESSEIVVCILDPTLPHDWRNPLTNLAYRLVGSSDPEHADGAEGLCANIAGKLAFYLRTGLASRLAESRPDLVEPGDFPHEGAARYRNYHGGASGLPCGADDWEVYCDCVDKLIELRAAAAATAIQESRDRVPGRKYLGGSPLRAASRGSSARKTVVLRGAGL